MNISQAGGVLVAPRVTSFPGTTPDPCPVCCSHVSRMDPTGAPWASGATCRLMRAESLFLTSRSYPRYPRGRGPTGGQASSRLNCRVLRR